MMPLIMSGVVGALLCLEGIRIARVHETKLRESSSAVTLKASDACPRVTMLVPAWNAREAVVNFMEAFRKLSYPSLELVLCAGGNDGTYETAKRFNSDWVHVIRQEPGDGKQGALRKAYAYANGDVIYLTDVDCLVTDDALYSLLDLLNVPEVNAVTGSSMPFACELSNPFVAVQWAVERSVELTKPQKVSGLLGRNAALKREVIEETERFGFSAPTGTDYTLAKEVLRRGHAIWYCPNSQVATDYPETFTQYIKKQRRWLGNVVKFGIRYSAWSDVLAVSRTLAMPVTLVGLAVFSVFWPWTWVIALGVMLHAASNRWIATKSCGLRAKPMAVLAHVVADQVAALSAGWAVIRGDLRW